MGTWSKRAAGLAAGVVVLLAAGGAGASAASPSAVTIQTSSNRADLISGGDAVMTIGLPAGATVGELTVRVGDRDVTRSFARRPGGRVEGLVTGLRVGPNPVTARLSDGRGARLTITNHPNGGPVFSGPQIQPWVCQKSAVDRQCNQPPTYEYLYRPTNPLDPALRPYDPQHPPSDVASTTTDDGATVPFIVRIETGYQDRDQYKIATLFQPGRPWDRWRPQPQFNHKLLITHGGGCGLGYGSTGAPSVTEDNLATGAGLVDGLVGADSVGEALKRGYVVMSTALDRNSHNCNIAVQAESLLMAKERVLERYGALRYTIGIGCSGGALTQQQVANAYPGIYQGLILACAYPDTLSPGAQFLDLHVMRRYFDDPSRSGSTLWTPLHMALVEGHLTPLNSITADEGLFKNVVFADKCPDEVGAAAYDRVRNPGGVRCTLWDYMVNVFGPRPAWRWTPVERRLGRGFVGLPLGNDGIQYGRQALDAGAISIEQFVDLNAEVGGLDLDGDRSDERSVADPGAVANAYRSGAINSTRNLDQVAIINHSGPDPGIAHDFRHALWTRTRMQQRLGHLPGNYVMWFGLFPVFGDPSYAKQALVAMDGWLANVERDRRSAPLARKIVDDRPADLQDRCSQIPGLDLVTLPGVGKVCENRVLQTALETPRSVAGDGPAGDVLECAKKPLRRQDYPAALSDEQWARLQRTFPTGVCDWSKPGVGQQPTVTWQTYQDAAGRVIYGGRPMGPAPTSARCSDRRRLSARLPAGRLRVAKVYVDGRRVQTLRGRTLRRPVRLARFPSGLVTVRVVARDRRGRRVVSERHFSVCRGTLPGE
ncbi:hypothetical protein PAI11_21850 [Patulibacter medicamentivorans]|uniref:DUF6351 domain-containing protein n=1 Tax=Patulibacter medicamentivorans TaxID=1097667 RepID=H0E5T6_9ACTN|nr:DUF6351 family protein [Patulibacter medicamentivorans]EHN10956.1 hypothetical protein PAI11_21850 [Patulibacter medicamentivorans]